MAINGPIFEMKKTNEWVLNKAEVKTELLDTVKARKLKLVSILCYNMTKQFLSKF